jgi:hypothetical protein
VTWWVIGEVEVLDRLSTISSRAGCAYKSERLHPMQGLSMPRYDLLKKNAT